MSEHTVLDIATTLRRVEKQLESLNATATELTEQLIVMNNPSYPSYALLGKLAKEEAPSPPSKL